MIFIKNYQNWIDERVIRSILNNPGDQRPDLNDPIHEYKKPIYNLLFKSGYDFTKLKWTLYYQSHFEKEIILPFDPGPDSRWWFCKLNPGDMFPMHQDLLENEGPNLRRFWLACRDKKKGHIFSYGDYTLNEYRSGDLFEFEDPKEWHAACNLGFEPKISLQIVSYSNSIVF